ncbi:transmembrane protein 254-like [Actinia tenebrosa]|uniref:Transmembrane protein 254 n=1 Tax=Actinia tenebrosa TaxID=6105 RepID=A0A6P8HQH6_ACTTE|nr:transmembrane protein 254-like [Actinia tenebrosa]
MAPPTRRRTTQRGSDENEPEQVQLEGDFFEFASSTWYALILSAVTLFWMVCFHPDLIPYSSLGPIGNFLFYLKDNYAKALEAGFRIMVLIHATEAFASYRLCRQLKFSMKTTMKWTIQTLFLGFASFGIILKYYNSRHNVPQEKEKHS